MSIKLKLFISFLLFAIIPMFIVALLSYYNAKNTLMTTHIGHLESIADLKVEKLEDFFKNMSEDARVAMDYWNIRSNLNIVSKYADDPNATGYLTARKRLDRQLVTFQKEKDYVDVMLVNLEGKVVYASNSEHLKVNLGKPLADPGGLAFEKGKDGVYFSDVFINPLDEDRFGMLVTAPVHDFNNNLIGVLALEIDMSPIYSFIEDTTGMGKTGETLVGIKKGDTALFLNPLRHNMEAALTKSADIGGTEAYPMQEAVRGRDGAGIQVDYRGEQVIAAWRHVPSLNWGLVAKIDTSEAFATIRTLRHLITVVGVILVVLVIVTTYYLVRSILNPLFALQKGIQTISGGNFDYKVATEAHDEIGQISKAFDAMTTNLKNITASRDDLNREIEARMKVETELRKLTVAIEQSPAVTVITDRNGSIEYVNPMFTEVTGYRAEEAIGNNPRILKSGTHPVEFYEELWKTITAGRVWQGDFLNKKKDGGLYWETATIRPIFDVNGEIEHYLAIKVDITDRKKAESRLNELLDELKRSNQALEQFAYIASHDLQEPLRMVTSYMQLLERRYKGKLDEDADTFIGFAVDGAKRMKVLINDLLAFSQVGSHGNPFVPTDFTEVINEVLSNLSVTIEESGATVTHDPMPVIEADKMQIAQLLQNLVGNAIKFSKAGPPKVHIGVKRDGGMWQFSVSDNGIGIAPEYYERIFQIFQRLHSKDKYSGTGIGLAVSKRIVERHKGRIWVESAQGKGTTFYFTIPA